MVFLMYNKCILFLFDNQNNKNRTRLQIIIIMRKYRLQISRRLSPRDLYSPLCYYRVILVYCIYKGNLIFRHYCPHLSSSHLLLLFPFYFYIFGRPTPQNYFFIIASQDHERKRKISCSQSKGLTKKPCNTHPAEQFKIISSNELINE